MGFWYFYVLPTIGAILLILLGNKAVVKQKIVGLISYLGAGIGYLMAVIFAAFYIYSITEEILTPNNFTKVGWEYFWSDNLIFVLVTIILIIISYFALKHSKAHKLQIK